MSKLRYLMVVAAFGVVMYGEDTTIPMDGGGNIIIRDAHFMTINQFNIYEPELSFDLVDNSSTPWKSVELQFEIGGFCKDEVRQWSDAIVVSPSERYFRHKDMIESLRFKLQGCRTEIIKVRIGDPTPENPSLSKREISEHKENREAKEFEERELKSEEQAKKAAAESARQRRVATEQKRKDAELNTRLAKYRTEKEAAAAEDRRRVRAACSVIYQNTVDKKVKELTVGEEQQVRACQALGLYPPR